MKKQNLKNEIIRKVYKLETKKTFFYLISKLFFGLIFLFLIFIFASVIFDILIEQGSFDLFNFFGDWSFEVFSRYFIDNLIVFYQELPQPLFFILILVIFILLVLVFLVVKNFRKIKNRLTALYKFYKKSK